MPKYSHRMSKTPEFQAWTDMQRRCYNPQNASYKHYGARGIRVAEEWRGRGGFARFIACIGLRPSKRHSLDRYPDKNGHYEPKNVRWATLEEQNQNKRDNVWLTYNNETLLVKEWSLRIGIKADTLYWRKRQGWSDEKTLTTPLLRGRRKRNA